jgi:serine/threonine protein kinase
MAISIAHMGIYCMSWLCDDQVLKKKPDFRDKPWPTISASAKDFVKKLLVKDAFARLTAAQALCMFPQFHVM